MHASFNAQTVVVHPCTQLLTGGHVEWRFEAPFQYALAQLQERLAVKGERSAHHHVQHNTQALLRS